MTIQTTVVLEHSVQDFVFAIDKLRQDGWQFDEQSPPGFHGWLYECHLQRDPTQEQLDKDAAEAAKPSRAEILAKARAAKAAKAASIEDNKQDE